MVSRDSGSQPYAVRRHQARANRSAASTQVEVIETFAPPTTTVRLSERGALPASETPAEEIPNGRIGWSS